MPRAAFRPLASFEAGAGGCSGGSALLSSLTSASSDCGLAGGVRTLIVAVFVFVLFLVFLGLVFVFFVVRLFVFVFLVVFDSSSSSSSFDVVFEVGLHASASCGRRGRSGRRAAAMRPVTLVVTAAARNRK